MGTSLIPIGNHKISLQHRSFYDLTSEIKSLLDSTKLLNADFLQQFALKWNEDNPAIIKEIETKKEWTFMQEDEYYSFDKSKYLELYGPHDLELILEENKLEFRNPPYRYRQWIILKKEDGSDADEHRNLWRQYMFQIISLFGGDRVIYLADNAYPLNKYIYFDCPFEEIEEALVTEFGKSCDTFKQVEQDLQRHYFIDRFSDLKDNSK